ncbi:low molecular weight protein arginine phosphatase [Sporosarcina cyprini]|uniref:low molecular weight protein arginine phosphatase n=1 Tax=Sporosarcina cyprini TaxID=2910523 RepID=UPI001EDE15BD|nr:low molecular weight protein arginine phosphatase [Sporosarcina cyprini]MCG3086329.1 low molecular weight protein arginine phosphatase [Sporosarcina cyprini]
MNIYLICTGNTCRSPMAEAILRSKNISGISVRSAGLHAADGFPISIHSETLIQEMDMPYTAESRVISREDVEWADLILTMTEGHKQAVLHRFPVAVGKLFTLKEYTKPDGDLDVQDPFGGNLLVYRETFEELTVYMDLLEKKLTEE